MNWTSFDAYEDANMTHCLCGHGIMERCVLRNRITECVALVGNKCVKQFSSHIALAAPTDAIFASIKRVRKDIDKMVHKDLAKLAREKGRTTARAERWYANSSRKRLLTTREIAYRRCLNRRIMSSSPPALLETCDASGRFCMPVVGPGGWTTNSCSRPTRRGD